MAARALRNAPPVARARAQQPARRVEPRDAQQLDRLIHDRVRLGILSALAAADVLSFGDLKSALELSDGNLSVHARKLEDAGYVTCTKGFEGRLPKTQFALTEGGHRALRQYLDHMEAIIRHARTRK